jgi:hypothetical protein
MKKTILTLILALLTTISFSQVWADATSLAIGYRDNAGEKFTWGETKRLDADIPVKIDNNEITIFTENIQYYQTLKPEYQTEDGNGFYWYAVDSNRKRCKFYMYGGEDSNVIMIEYDDVCIIYGVIYR